MAAAMESGEIESSLGGSWKLAARHWLFLTAALGLLVLVFWDGLRYTLLI